MAPLDKHSMHPEQTHRPGRSVFRTLLISMLLFGASVGLAFPFILETVLKPDLSLSFRFFCLCVTAGILVGLVNFFLFKVVVSRELFRLVSGMTRIVGIISSKTMAHGIHPDEHMLDITSSDDIGNIQNAFNTLTKAIIDRLRTDEDLRILNHRLTSSVELEQVSEVILSAMMEQIHARAGVMYVDIGETLQRVCSVGTDRSEKLPDTVGKDYGPISHCLISGDIRTLSPINEGLQWIELSTPLGKFTPACIVIIPLMTKQHATGLVCMACRDTELATEAKGRLDELRHLCSPYLHNAVLHRQLRDQAAMDHLTSVLNRRFGMRRLEKEYSRSVRHGMPLSVILLDIDHFKRINDTLGHDAGDAILKLVASAIEKNLRAGDAICRYGGEEFLIVAPGTGIKDCALLAERIRSVMASTKIPWKDQTLRVTLSMGIATWPVSTVSTPDELVSLADKALYFSKDSGRNSVSVYSGEKSVPFSELNI